MPSTWGGVFGIWVIVTIRMISRTLRTSTPYSSLSRWKLTSWVSSPYFWLSFVLTAGILLMDHPSLYFEFTDKILQRLLAMNPVNNFVFSFIIPPLICGRAVLTTKTFTQLTLMQPRKRVVATSGKYAKPAMVMKVVKICRAVCQGNSTEREFMEGI